MNSKKRMTQTERAELQDILIAYVENPRRMGPCIMSIEELFRKVHSRWIGFRHEHRNVSVADDVIEEVCQKHKVDLERIRGPRRSKYLVKAREEIAFTLWKRGFTYAEIARAINRHPSTVIYSIEKMKKE